MNTSPGFLNRREFTKSTLMAGVTLAAGAFEVGGAEPPARRILEVFLLRDHPMLSTS